MKRRNIYVGVACICTAFVLSACGGKNSAKEVSNDEEMVTAVEEETTETEVAAIPFADKTIVSKWKKTGVEMTIWEDNNSLFITLFNTESKEYSTVKVEECQVEDMAGYREVDNHKAEYLTDSGSLMYYLNGDLVDTYDWVE